MSATKKALPAGRRVPKIVGYSLGVCVAVIALLVFFWVLTNAYDITLIVDSDTHVTFQNFFDALYSIFIIILGFVVFPPLLHFTLEGIYSLRNKKKKNGVLHMIAKNSKKIVYSGTIGYWFLYIVALSIYFIFSSGLPVGK